MTGIEWLVNGRMYCAACRLLLQVIYTPDAEIVCGRCLGPVIIACGDEETDSTEGEP